MRKGRCSNDIRNCTLALNKTELPYAGVDSVCPECGAPLAAIAQQTFETPPPVPPPPVPPPPPAQTQRVDDLNTYTPSNTAPYREGLSSAAYPEAPAPNSAMKVTQIAIVGAALALGAFFVWKMFLQPRPATNPDAPPITNTAQTGPSQVTQISPPQLRRVNVAAQAYTAPDAATAVAASLAPGSLLDVTGQVQVGGVNWLRVTLPSDSSKSGFVREDQLAVLADGGLANGLDVQGLPIVPPTTGTLQPPAPEAIGPVQVREPTTFYVVSSEANIRQEAGATSPKLSTSYLSDPLTVIAQRSVGARIWYQVQLSNGGTGWVNSSLVATTQRLVPIDGVKPKSKVDVTVDPGQNPNTKADGPDSQIGEMDNQEAMRAYGAGTTLRVDATSANLRKNPGAAGNAVLESMPRDTIMSVEDVRIVDGVPWYRVTSPNRVQGWVSGRTVVAD